jgi:hypothetical protein
VDDERTVTARDVLGIPVVPPGSITAAGGRLRARVLGVGDRMVPPPVQVLEALFGVLDHRVLVLLCRLDVPDELDGRMTVEELGRRVGADPARLERLVRYAAVRRWLKVDRKGRVRPNDVTEFLRRDHPGGWRAWVDFAGSDEVVDAIGALSATDDAHDAFAAVHGTSFFPWMEDHPERWEVFDRAMAAGGRMHALTLLAAVDFEATRSVCDVGGGTGALLTTLLDHLPEVEGTLLDLPAVVARAGSHPRLTVLAGDAFESVPPGHGTYLLVNVVHDWGDDDVVRLLSNVAGAIGDSGGRLLVVEAARAVAPQDRTFAATDVMMAALTPGGRERSADEVARLGGRSGLRLHSSTRLASGDWAHQLEVPTSGDTLAAS